MIYLLIGGTHDGYRVEMPTAIECLEMAELQRYHTWEPTETFLIEHYFKHEIRTPTDSFVFYTLGRMSHEDAIRKLIEAYPNPRNFRR